MTQSLRWGILGPGGIARKQASDLLLAGHLVTAVGSRRLEAARAFADEFGIATAHGSYEELVADPNVDVIYVATPHSHHYQHARLALEAGKHVLVEKAFTVTAPQAEALVALAAELNLVVLEAMWTRFLPHMLRIHEIIAAGTIGEVRTLIADHNQRLSTDPENRINNPALAGGALLDLGIYPLSFAADLFGTPESVLAAASFTTTGVDRQTSVILTYSGDRHAVIQTALDQSGGTRAMILGSLGSIEIDSAWYAPTSFTVFGENGDILERWDSPIEGKGSQFQAAELERLVAEGRLEGERMPATESIAIMTTLDEIRRQIGLNYPADIMGV